MTNAIREGVFPGCAVAFGNENEHIVKAFGSLTYENPVEKVSGSTWYDLASLTKVLATTYIVHRFLKSGHLDLEAKIGDVLGSFSMGERADISVWNLLTHTSGLPAHRDFYMSEGSREEVWDAVLNEPLIATLGTQVTYSCVGFLILQAYINRILEGDGDFLNPFNEFVKHMNLQAGFGPIDIQKFQVAPTEADHRGSFWQGIVHDENSRRLGGSCANAGLFGSIEAVNKMVQWWLNPNNALDLKLVNQMIARQPNAGTRAIGWDTKSETGSSAGTLFGPKSFGHTGFTGNSIWVDPETKIYGILLSNRVYPTRENTKIVELRPKFYDEVLRAMVR